MNRGSPAFETNHLASGAQPQEADTRPQPLSRFKVDSLVDDATMTKKLLKCFRYNGNTSGGAGTVFLVISPAKTREGTAYDHAAGDIITAGRVEGGSGDTFTDDAAVAHSVLWMELAYAFEIYYGKATADYSGDGSTTVNLQPVKNIAGDAFTPAPSAIDVDIDMGWTAGPTSFAPGLCAIVSGMVLPYITVIDPSTTPAGFRYVLLGYPRLPQGAQYQTITASANGVYTPSATIVST